MLNLVWFIFNTVENNVPINTKAIAFESRIVVFNFAKGS